MSALLGDELEPKAAPPRDRSGRSSDRGRRAGDRGARRVDELVDVLVQRGGDLTGEPPARDRVCRAGDDRVEYEHRDRSSESALDQRRQPVLVCAASLRFISSSSALPGESASRVPRVYTNRARSTFPSIHPNLVRDHSTHSRSQRARPFRQ